MSTEIKFVSATATDNGILCRYKAKHSTDGPRGTTLDFDLQLLVPPTHFTIKAPYKLTIDLGPAEKDTPQEAIEKMSEWLQRASEALKATPVRHIPLFE